LTSTGARRIRSLRQEVTVRTEGPSRGCRPRSRPRLAALFDARGAFWLAAAAFTLPAAVLALSAQGPATLGFRVRETVGIQRTQYPVRARIPLRQGILTNPTAVRLSANGTEVPAQFSAASSWSDGSIQTLDVDFNASLEPEEERRYQLEYGAGIAPVPSTARALSVVEQADAIQVGNLRFSRSGTPLLSSAAYRVEAIGKGRNGVAVIDDRGRRHDLTTARNPAMDVLKRGPLMVALRYSAALPIDEAYSAAVEVLIEMPNSKSWVKMSASVRDPGRRVRDISIETPFAFDAFPWSWDFGTDSGTYGAFRAASDLVLLTQTTTAAGPTGWTIQTGAKEQMRRYETSAGRQVKTAAGWGHIQDAQSVVAFALDSFGRNPGTYTIGLTGQGQASFRYAPAAPPLVHQVTVYQHFVPAPVAIGAATNPTSMLNPPVVTIDR
jgi:hypothetical protein